MSARSGWKLSLAVLGLCTGCAARHAVRCDTHLVPINPPPLKVSASVTAPSPAPAVAATPSTPEASHPSSQAAEGQP